MRTKQIFLILFCIIVLFLMINPCVHVRHYAINHPKIHAKIAVISDLHSQLPKYLIKKIQKEKPDLILLPGDIIDDKRDEAPAFTFLKACAAIAPTYYVIGNHEVWMRDFPRLKEKIAETGVILLNNSYEVLLLDGEPIILAGIDDPYNHPNYDITPIMKSCFSSLPDGYKILLAHRPEEYPKYMEYGFDLVVSGHAHGGQWRIPFLLNGLYAPNQGFFPKRAGGMYHEESMHHMVSRGIYYACYLRIFNPPEFSIITLCP